MVGTEIKLRAERKAGELLREMEKANGARGKAGPGRGNKTESPKSDPVFQLKDLGISKNDSSLWQKLARIPEPEFEKSPKSSHDDFGKPPELKDLGISKAARRAEGRGTVARDGEEQGRVEACKTIAVISE